jgi:hypothetical protein
MFDITPCWRMQRIDGVNCSFNSHTAVSYQNKIYIHGGRFKCYFTFLLVIIRGATPNQTVIVTLGCLIYLAN